MSTSNQRKDLSRENFDWFSETSAVRNVSYCTVNNHKPQTFNNEWLSCNFTLFISTNILHLLEKHCQSCIKEHSRKQPWVEGETQLTLPKILSWKWRIVLSGLLLKIRSVKVGYELCYISLLAHSHTTCVRLQSPGRFRQQKFSTSSSFIISSWYFRSSFCVKLVFHTYLKNEGQG